MSAWRRFIVGVVCGAGVASLAFSFSRPSPKRMGCEEALRGCAEDIAERRFREGLWAGFHDGRYRQIHGFGKDAGVRSDARWDAGEVPDAHGGVVYTPTRYGSVDADEWDGHWVLLELKAEPPLEGRAARLRRASCDEACMYGSATLHRCLVELGSEPSVVEVP